MHSICKILLAVMIVRSNAMLSTSSPSKEQHFCTKQGGKVKEYVLWNGNAPGLKPVGIQIASTMKVCSIPNEEGSNAYLVSLETLASTRPTLAVLAFQARTGLLSMIMARALSASTAFSSAAP